MIVCQAEPSPAQLSSLEQGQPGGLCQRLAPAGCGPWGMPTPASYWPSAAQCGETATTHCLHRVRHRQRLRQGDCPRRRRPPGHRCFHRAPGWRGTAWSEGWPKASHCRVRVPLRAHLHLKRPRCADQEKGPAVSRWPAWICSVSLKLSALRADQAMFTVGYRSRCWAKCPPPPWTDLVIRGRGWQ
jgi:hypothetical protein